MQSLDSYSGTVWRNYHLQHIMYKSPVSPMATLTQASFSTLRTCSLLYWPGNDLAVFLVFAPALLFCQLTSSNGQISRHKCLIKYLIFLPPQAFCDAFYASKFVFGWGSAPDRAGGAHDAPPDPLVPLAGGYPLPIPHPPRRLWRLDLGVPNFISRKLATYLPVIDVHCLSVHLPIVDVHFLSVPSTVIDIHRAQLSP